VSAGEFPASLRQSNNQFHFDAPGGQKETLPGREVLLMATRIRPLADRLIVKRVDDQEQKSAGGIIIPDTAKEKPQEGKVVAVGRGKLSEEGKVIPLDVKAGDRILFGKYSGSEIKIDGEEHLILREEDVLGVVEA
jgi:chaperonin GroES